MPPEETHPFRADIYPLLQEGVEAHWSPERILRELAGPMNLHTDAYSAAEAFMTSTTSFVLPVTSIDGWAIGDGRPGPLTRTLSERYLDHVANRIATA